MGGRCAYTCKVSVRHCAIGAVLHAPTPGKPCASNVGGGLASPEQWSPGFLWVLRDFNLSIVNEVCALPLLRGFFVCAPLPALARAAARLVPGLASPALDFSLNICFL